MSDLSDLERGVLEHLDEEALCADLVELVRIPSVDGSPEEVEIVETVADLVGSLGLHRDHWEIDLADLAADPWYPGHEVERDRAQGLVASTAPLESTPALVLQGHLDVVPPGDAEQWALTDPFSGEIRDGRVYGRGTCDMKAGVAANIAVARTLLASGIALDRPLGLHFVVGEEDGGLGAFATLRRGHTADAAVITEPTADRLVIGNAGALTFRIEVSGQSAHGSLRLEGVSAFEAFLPVHEALRELETRRNARPDALFADRPLPYALTFGIVRAGEWSSSVPDRLIAEGRYGVMLGEDPGAARAAFEAAVAEAAVGDPWLREHRPTVTWPGGQFASGRTDSAASIVDAVAAAVRDSGSPDPARIAEVYGSDLRLYTGIGGIPTVHYGPGDPRVAHAPLEHVEIDDLVAATRALLLLAVRSVGG